MRQKQNLVASVPATRACELTGVSHPMLDYLTREQYLSPSASGELRRGKRRLFTFGDLIVLRVIVQLLGSGIEIRRLKKGLKRLQEQSRSMAPGELPLRFLVTDGHEVYLKAGDGRLESLSTRGQLAFAFIVDLQQSQRDVIKAGALFGGWASTNHAVAR